MTTERPDVYPAVILEIENAWDGAAVVDYSSSRVELRLTEHGLNLHFSGPLMGDPAPAEPPGRLWGLWKHEVLECFIVGPDSDYLEVEVGPHGHFLILRLHGVRTIVNDAVPARLQWHTTVGGVWSVSVVIGYEYLPPLPWKMNAFAMYGDAPRRFLASTPVSGDGPDFHRISQYTASFSGERALD